MKDLISASFSIVAACLALLTLIPAALFAYWAIDRKMPIRHVTGRFVTWESLNPPIARIQWSGERSRLCLGQTMSWVYADSPINLPATALPHKDSVTSSGDGPGTALHMYPPPRPARYVSAPGAMARRSLRRAAGYPSAADAWAVISSYPTSRSSPVSTSAAVRTFSLSAICST